MKTIVYSALFGSYDTNMKEFDYDREKFQFILFTNMKRLKSSTWDIRYVDELPVPNDLPRSSYYYKTNPHVVLPKESDISVWVDFSFVYFNPQELDAWVSSFRNSPESILIEKHPGRNCVYQELEANCAMNKDDVDAMRVHVESYRKEGMPANFGLVETGFQIRKHFDSDLIKFQEFLWNEMITKTRRDQLSWNYSVWKTGFKNYKLCTIDQKHKVVMFQDHPHRPNHVEKVALVGPWLGEDYIEESWIEYVKGELGKTPVDKVVVGCKIGREPLYKDINADKIVTIEPKGEIYRHMVDGRTPTFHINTTDKEVVRIEPTNSVMESISKPIGKIVVLYNWFEHGNKQRREEMLFAFRHIVQSQNIDSVVVCTDTNNSPPIQNDKIEHEICSSRPTYRELFDIGNKYVGEDDVQILINSDCFFDEVSLKKISSFICKQEFWAISRVELLSLNSYEHNRRIDPKGSQDAWCVRGKISDDVSCDLKMGMPGCDHRIAFEFYNSKYVVKNHCDNLVLYHAHISGDRSYTQSDILKGDCIHVVPTHIGTPNTNVSLFRII